MKSDDVDSKRLAGALREKRQGKGLTQKKLGERFGLSAGSIGWLENGNTKRLAEGKVKKILSFLGIDLSEFMREEEKAPAPDVTKKRIGASKKPLKHKGRPASPEVVKESGSPGNEERKEPCTVTARVTGEMYKKVREYGDINELTMGDVVRMAMERFFAEPERSEEVSARVDIPPHAPAELSAFSPDTPSVIESPAVESKKEAPPGKKLEQELGKDLMDELLGENGEEEESVSIEEVKMLLKGGHGCEEIGELMGVPPERVVQMLRGEQRRQRMSKRKEFLERDLNDLETIKTVLWEKAVKGSFSAIDLMIRIMELRTKLMESVVQSLAPKTTTA
jgi:transcriptional regulator with XRE-family HTH domain